MEQDENKVLSIWQFLGYQLLFSIPCVGFICMIVFACGTIKNNNVKNWSRAMLIMFGIFFLLYLILFMVGIGTIVLSEIR